MKIIRIKKRAQMPEDKEKEYTVRSVFQDLSKWEKFLEVVNGKKNIDTSPI